MSNFIWSVSGDCFGELKMWKLLIWSFRGGGALWEAFIVRNVCFCLDKVNGGFISGLGKVR